MWADAVLLLRRHPFQFVISALVLTVAGSLIESAWGWVVTTLVDESDPEPAQLAQLGTLSLLLSLAVFLTVFALTGALQAVLVVQTIVGRPVTIRAALRLLAPRIRAVLGVTALLTVVPQLVLLALIAVLSVFIWQWLSSELDAFLATGGDPVLDSVPPSPSEALIAVAVIVVPTFALLSLVWVVMALALLFAPITAALEPLRFGGAVRRSMLLVGNNLWRIVGIILLNLLIALPIILPLFVPLVLIGSIFSVATADLPSWAQEVMSWPFDLMIAAFIAWQVTVLVLLYIDVRIRQEGLAADLWQRRTAASSGTPDGGAGDPTGDTKNG
ncbi:hypothetical protein [Nonomuraea jiangxiensis]|nr:hypothetical protein [Nonomuraea jiangxiensis]